MTPHPGCRCQWCNDARLDALRPVLPLGLRWRRFLGILLALALGLTALAHAQNGLYNPQPIPMAPRPPMSWGGLIIDADAIVEMDTTIAVQYAPPAEYAQWWQEMGLCAQGVTKKPVSDMRNWAFVGVDAPAFRVRGNGPYVGYTLVDKQTILLPLRYIGERQLVAHEMLHAILWDMKRKDFGHPQGDWIFKLCGVFGQ